MKPTLIMALLLVVMGAAVASGVFFDVGGGNPTVTVSGYVLSSTSIPIVGAEVRRCSVCAPVITDVQGHYSQNVVSDATYTFTVSATGFQPVTRDILVPYGSNVRADFTLSPEGGPPPPPPPPQSYDCDGDGTYESSTPCSPITPGPDSPTDGGTQTFGGKYFWIGIVLIIVGIAIAVVGRG